MIIKGKKNEIIEKIKAKWTKEGRKRIKRKKLYDKRGSKRKN